MKSSNLANQNSVHHRQKSSDSAVSFSLPSTGKSSHNTSFKRYSAFVKTTFMQILQLIALCPQAVHVSLSVWRQ
jgi:hypothetical protein